ncbi:amidohydrolase [Hymenobacter sp. ASUV-10]|uniref:Amidohydrolase n=1 Tax=Hymenobacter aranciens TaxID=3063996 RepID=A0ABT9B9G5_9BACT|nr:amidohydrolase [Hymenobacter sp. ASUV-10]MDO7874912.1 amidohydrolase [Hymenobacter sp. ASUV-10]
MNDLTVSMVQANLHWQDAAANRATLDRCLSQISISTDLIVLPEMFTTGFSMDAAALAETMDGPTVAWMRQHAAAHQAVITGSSIIEENGQYFNRLLWVRPDSSLSYYDKRHLFTLAREQDTYTAGTTRLIEEWRGWRICPLVCYDLRFPVWSRNEAAQPYDLLLYVANWPAVRRNAWITLLRARAIENLSYVLGVNRVGQDGLGHDYAGDSALLDMRGEYLLQAGNLHSCITRTLRWDDLEDFRTKFPALNDADPFSLSPCKAETRATPATAGIPLPHPKLATLVAE